MLQFNAILLVGAGGAVGAILRYLLAGTIGVNLFPWATLTINIAGAALIGMLWGAFSHTQWFVEWGRLFLVVGVLGGFTTFSAFSYELLTLLHDGRTYAAAGYVMVSVLVCLVAVYLGFRGGEIIAQYLS